MIWEILSLSRLQKMLELRDTLSGMYYLKNKLRVCLYQFSANTSKGSEGHNPQSHKELFEEIKSVTLRSPPSQETSRKFKGVVPQIISVKAKNRELTI